MPLQKADRDVRDVVVLRCRACCDDPKEMQLGYICIFLEEKHRPPQSRLSSNIKVCKVNIQIEQINSPMNNSKWWGQCFNSRYVLELVFLSFRIILYLWFFMRYRIGDSDKFKGISNSTSGITQLIFWICKLRWPEGNAAGIHMHPSWRKKKHATSKYSE